MTNPNPQTADPIDAVPDPQTVRVMLADAIRRRDLLRSLLRVAVRKANYPPQAPQSPTDRKGVQHVA